MSGLAKEICLVGRHAVDQVDQFGLEMVFIEQNAPRRSDEPGDQRSIAAFRKTLITERETVADQNQRPASNVALHNRRITLVLPQDSPFFAGLKIKYRFPGYRAGIALRRFRRRPVARTDMPPFFEGRRIRQRFRGVRGKKSDHDAAAALQQRFIIVEHRLRRSAPTRGIDAQNEEARFRIERRARLVKARDVQRGLFRETFKERLCTQRIGAQSRVGRIHVAGSERRDHHLPRAC